MAGVQFSVLCVVIMMATFIPKGSFKWNPYEISGQSLQSGGGEEEERRESEEVKPGFEFEFEDYGKGAKGTMKGLRTGEENYTAYVEADGSFDGYQRNRTRS